MNDNKTQVLTYDKSHDVVQQITSLYHDKISNKFGQIFQNSNNGSSSFLKLVEEDEKIKAQEEKENEERTELGFEDMRVDDEQQQIVVEKPQESKQLAQKSKQPPKALRGLMKSISNSKSKFNDMFEDKDFVMTDSEMEISMSTDSEINSAQKAHEGSSLQS